MDGARPIVAMSEGFADYGDYYGFGYGRPLLAAGALPVLLPVLRAGRRTASSCIARVDGLVLAGGRDIESWRYGREEPHPKQGDAPAAPGRDRAATTRGWRWRPAFRCSACAAGARS